MIRQAQIMYKFKGLEPLQGARHEKKKIDLPMLVLYINPTNYINRIMELIAGVVLPPNLYGAVGIQARCC